MRLRFDGRRDLHASSSAWALQAGNGEARQAQAVVLSQRISKARDLEELNYLVETYGKDFNYYNITSAIARLPKVHLSPSSTSHHPLPRPCPAPPLIGHLYGDARTVRSSRLINPPGSPSLLLCLSRPAFCSRFINADGGALPSPVGPARITTNKHCRTGAGGPASGHGSGQRWGSGRRWRIHSALGPCQARL